MWVLDDIQRSRDFRYRYRMRLLCILTVMLLAATASADSRTVPFEIVNVMPSTQQVLVFDRAHNTHVLLAAGSTFEDYLVVEVRGIGVTMEREQERFTVYPRAAQGLVLYLDESNQNRPPAIYSQVEPDAAAADPQAVALASLLTAWVASLFV